jgi:hypothetical protein
MRFDYLTAQCLVKLAQATFMAVGPPAAPEAQYMRSSLDFEEMIRMIEPLPPAAPYSNFTDRHYGNSTIGPDSNSTIEESGRWHDLSSTVEVTDAAATASYWWLADEKFNHKVGVCKCISHWENRWLIQQPYAGKGYTVFRDVKKFGAKGDGKHDDWEAIMKAVKSGDPKYNSEVQRCGADCNATSTRGALVYFPPGDYLISKPIMQYYYTAFAGHPISRANIKGRKDFKGIALIDTDYYIPDTKGAEW